MSQAANQAGNDREHPLHASAVHTPAHAAPTFGIQSSRKTPRHSRGGALPPRMARLWTSSAACLCRMAPRRALPARLRWCVRLPTRLSASMPFAAHPHAAGTQTQGGGALAIGIERLSVSEQCGASTSTAYAVVTVGDSIVSMKGGGRGASCECASTLAGTVTPPPPPQFSGNMARDRGGAVLLSAGALRMEVRAREACGRCCARRVCPACHSSLLLLLLHCGRIRTCWTTG